MAYIQIINGPNLNLLGRRRPDIYGQSTLDDINDELRGRFAATELRFAQSNSEGTIIEAIHAAGFDSECLGIVLNAGAYTHYSYAIADAIEAVDVPVVEVHISNIHAREDFRNRSVIAPVCRGSIAGFGKYSYFLAIEAILHA